MDANVQQHEVTKEHILDLVRAYINQQTTPKFVPGKSRVHYAGRVYDADEVCNLVDAALDFWLTLGPYGRKMEQALSEFQGCADTVLACSGSAANLVAMAALCAESVEGHLCPGDEVITPAVTFPTTFNPIVQHGMTPVVVDCDVETLNINPELFAEAIGPKTRAVFLPHTLGNPFDLDTVTRLCHEHHLWLIEDTCDAFGSTWNGKRVGTFGALGTLSCYPAHHITMGEGGAVFVNDDRLTRTVRSVRDWGR
ncbi:MAG TPA: DegT/DnrJ/EryC1/StrS family aminotransferase, partial [Armatimonadota bacterium]|nr:DegT/DnrJ/EryC1/StrS family aminotransferase [Armatimonadota bacterium]